MEVVLATDSFEPKVDGVADTSAIVARSLSRRGHRVQVIAPGPGPSVGDGYSIVRLPSMPCPLYPELRLASPPFSLARLYRRRPPDAAVVLTTGIIGLSIAASLPARTRLVHIYTTDVLHYLAAYGLSFLRQPVGRMLHWMNNRAAVTLCPTEFVRDALASEGHRRLVVWGRGVDAELFHPERRSSEMRSRLTGEEPEKPLAIYVGRLAREKRLADLLEAGRQVPGARFALVGDGPERDSLERKFAAIPSVFTGFLRGERLAEAFASADMFVFPSESETFGHVVLQAMASGVPPIVVAGTAPAELVTHGVTGLHVRPRSPDEMASAMSMLIHDEATRRSMASAARCEASRLSWEALVDQLEDLMVGTRPGPAIVGVPA